ncbi:MAG TPA: hypothetical protein DDY43_11785 [Synechococcales bacterium UBA10510]|nr:hypothetical protein [Synechococcales bacterium UBA10510]
MLRLARFKSIQSGIQALMHYMMALLAMVGRPPEAKAGLTILKLDLSLDLYLVQTETVAT